MMMMMVIVVIMVIMIDRVSYVSLATMFEVMWFISNETSSDIHLTLYP